MQTIKISSKDKDILRAVLDAFPEGVGINVLRQALRVLDKIENCDELLLLEDADVTFLLARFAETKFIRADRDIIALFDRISSPPTVLEADEREIIPFR